VRHGSTSEVDLFARGSDGAFWTNYGYTLDNWNTTFWVGWTSLGGVFLGMPSAAPWRFAHDGIVLAGRATDYQIYVRVYNPDPNQPSWTDWAPVSHGGVFSNEPAVTYVDPYIYVFANGTDNGVYWSRNDTSNGFNPDPNAWTVWKGAIPEGVLSSQPAAGTFRNVIYVVGRGTTNLYHITKSTDMGNTWSHWQTLSLTNTFSSGPALTIAPNGDLNVFGTSAVNGHMLASTSPDGGTTWAVFQDASGVLNASPAAAQPTQGLIQTFGRGTDNTIYWNRYQE
jgi:hypothetical protein